MLKRRLIFTLLLRSGVYMLSRNFRLQSVGTLDWIREYYDFDAIAFSIDELVVLNVERGPKDVTSFASHLRELSANCFMPIAAGGGIDTQEDAYRILDAGADKLVVNTTLVDRPELVTTLARTFGSQAVVASIDYRRIEGRPTVFIDRGRRRIDLSLEEVVRRSEELGAGEIYLTSVERDGTGQGYDLETLRRIVDLATVPVIASGGVGHFQHLVDGIKLGRASAVSTANLFNFIEDALTEARRHMRGEGIDLADWRTPARTAS